jgi:hypothetical protein
MGTWVSGCMPEDIGDKDLTLEWEPRSADERPACPRDGCLMINQRQTYALARGRFVVTYEAWVCAECGEVFLDRWQAKRYGAIQMLDRLLKERDGSAEGRILFDGEDIFVSLSLVQDLAALWRQTVKA